MRLWLLSIATKEGPELLDLTCVLVTQLCPTLNDPVDCSPPGSSVLGIPQARMLEQVAIWLHYYCFALLDRFSLLLHFLTFLIQHSLAETSPHTKGGLRTWRGRTPVPCSISLWGCCLSIWGEANSLVGDCDHESFRYQEEKKGRWHIRYSTWTFPYFFLIPLFILGYFYEDEKTDR